MNKVYTKALHYITVEGCRFETVLRYNPSTQHIGTTTTRRGNYTAERSERAEYARDYRKEKPEAESVRTNKWRAKNPEYMPSYLQRYHEEHGEEIKAQNKEYYERRKDYILTRNRQYATDHPRDPRDYILPPYQCTKLNDWFDGCRRHHVDPSTIVHIPADMHITNTHNIRTWDGMDVINSLALEFISMK